MIPIIDTHQHLILNERWPYSWAEGTSFLNGKRFGPEDYADLSAGTGITHTLFMETSPDDPYWREETEHAYELAERPDSPVIGVIGNCRPENEGFEAFLDEYEHPKRVGLRRTLHFSDDSISQADLFRSNIRLLADRNLSFDLCFQARQLPVALELARACPNVQFILDHCGVPDIANQALDPWRDDLRSLASCENVACKVSGVLAYCNPENATRDAVQPYIEHVIESFGWERVVWGSDWPVCTKTSHLSEWVAISREIVSHEDESHQWKLFHDNALKIYGAKP